VLAVTDVRDLLCYFRSLCQFRILLHIKWGTARARVGKLNQGNVSTISRATKYQSAQTVSISNRNVARIEYAATRWNFRLMTVRSRDLGPSHSCERMHCQERNLRFQKGRRLIHADGIKSSLHFVTSMPGSCYELSTFRLFAITNFSGS